ncbi:MAG: peptidylprolyl isomerase [Saprospiraceae bacterium]
MKIRNLLFYAAIVVFGISCSKPVSQFTYQLPKGKTAPAVVTFDNTSKNAESYEWNFGDGTTSKEIKPQHKYKLSGNYTVSLKAKKGRKFKMSEEKIHVEAPGACLVEIETDFGTIVCELSNATPQHRDNFIKVAEAGKLDGTLFHRVIKGFMIQGGDPTSVNATAQTALGGGDLGYTVPAEFVDSLVHLKGALCAARTNNPQKASSASQFYIVQGKPVDDKMLDMLEGQGGFHYSTEQREAYKQMGGTPFLDRNYTVFGRVVSGLEVIDKIASTQIGPMDRPVKDVKMKVTVIK